MRKYPGIVCKITQDGTWIRPKSGGSVKGPRTTGLNRGDSVEYSVSGNGLAVLEIFKHGMVKNEMNPLPTNEEGDGWYEHNWDFNEEFWVVPIWEFQGTGL